MIDVRNLSFAFGRQPILDNMSFHVAKGESLGIVGPSGTGKTTLLNLLTRLLPAPSGTIFLAGQPLDSYTLQELARLQQMVFQDPYSALHPKFKIEKTFAEIGRAQQIPDWHSRMDALLQNVHLDPALAQRFPHQLSGGQRQRIVIACALLANPQVLYLDEPTSALDVSVQAEILNLLKDLQEERALTMILITHDPAISAFMCQRQLLLSRP